jgi:hypothetical protein
MKDHAFSSKRRAVVPVICWAWWLALLTALVAACAPAEATWQSQYAAAPEPPVAGPMLIQGPQVLEQTSTESQFETLRRELEAPQLVIGAPHMSAEQIAAMAVSELKLGHDWDAALLLAIATFRYQQQLGLVVEVARREARTGQASETIATLRDRERIALTRQHFIRELRQLRSHWRQPSEPTPAEGAAAEPRVPLPPLESLGYLRPSPGTRPELLAHPQLADVFLTRVLADKKRGLGGLALEMVPLVAFRRALLQISLGDYLMPHLLPDVVGQAVALRPDLLALLRHAQPAPRSNAAYLLGAAQQSEARDALRTALSEERDERVLASLRFALLSLGDSAQLEPLQAAFASPKSEVATHAIALAPWLPDAAQLRLSLDALLAVVNDARAHSDARADAVTTLGMLGERHDLSERALTTLLRVCDDGKERAADEACSAIHTLQQLKRERVLELIRTSHSVRLQGALLVRLEALVLPSDLPLLEAEYARAVEDSKQQGVLGRTAGAVAVIPGERATQLLLKWYEKLSGSSQEDYMAVLLCSRPDLTPAARLRVSSRLNARRRFVLNISCDSEAAAESAKRLAAAHDHDALLDGISAAGFARRPSALPVLWELATYRDATVYPYDLLVRRAAMGSIVRIEIERAKPSVVGASSDVSPAEE